MAGENFIQNPAIAKLVADERRQVAEQIAEAIDKHRRDQWLDQASSSEERAERDALVEAAKIAREVGTP